MRRTSLGALALLVGCAPAVHWVRHLPERRVQVVQTSGEWCVEVAGEASFRRCHEGLAVETLRATALGISYAARDASRWRVYVARGSSFAPHLPKRDWAGVAEVAQTTSGAPAYIARDERGWWVVVDRRATGPWPDVFEGSLRLAGDTYAYVASTASASYVVVDGEVSDAWDGVGHLRLLEDSVLYLARRGGAAYVVVGSQTHGPYRQVTSVVERGRDAGWVAQRGDGWVAVVAGRSSEPFEAIHSLTLAADGFSEAFAARVGTRERVVLDGQSVGVHDGVLPGGLAFVGQRLARVTRDRGRWWIRVGDADYGPFHDVAAIEAGGGRWAAVVRPRAGGELAIWVDGRVIGHAGWVADLTVDARGVAYVAASENGARVVVDGVSYPFEVILEGSLVLADEGRHWGCVVMDEDGARPRVVVDGVREVPLRVDDLVSSTLGEDPIAIAASASERVRAQVRARIERYR